MAKTKIKKLEDEVKDATNKADKDVERANQSYHEFMSYYSDYQSDLKRRGMSTMRTDAGELRRGREKTEKSNRQSKDSNKETKGVNK